MSDQHGCDMVLLVQAEFDGELDAAQAAALAAHRAGCPVCQAAGHELAEAREHCYSRYHKWWDEDTHSWHTDHDWNEHDHDHDEHH